MRKTNDKAGVVRYFLGLFLPISIVISIALFCAYKIEANSFKKIMLVNEKHIANLYMESITNTFNNAINDTLFLSMSEDIKEIMKGANSGPSEHLKQEFIAFCELNPSCVAISVLNSTGKKILGMTKEIAGASVEAGSRPAGTNKYKAIHARSMKLGEGETYFSPVEAGFSHEEGADEEKEHISIITPLFSADHKRTGSILVTLLAEKLIGNLETPEKEQPQSAFDYRSERLHPLRRPGPQKQRFYASRGNRT